MVRVPARTRLLAAVSAAVLLLGGVAAGHRR